MVNPGQQIKQGQENLDGFEAKIAQEEKIKNSVEAVKRLAKLTKFEYGLVRKEEAKRLAVSVKYLDDAVKEEQQQQAGTEAKHIICEDVEPWSHSVHGETLLDEIFALINRHCICKEETAWAATLWIAATWFLDYVHVAPIACIVAPEKRCGKSSMLALLARTCKRPLMTANISASALFRATEQYHPTLLIDEADAFLKENETLRGLLDAGHTREFAFTVRTVGDNHDLGVFSTWGFKAIAAIGKLPDTIMDRSIVLELRRMKPGEAIVKLRHADPQTFEIIRGKLARFAEDYGETIWNIKPEEIKELNSRAEDNWEPLFLVASLCGEKWQDLARQAALHISCNEEDTLSYATELLINIKSVFDGLQCNKITTADLIRELCKDEEWRWCAFNKGKEITPRQLGGLLKRYGIESKNIRTPDSQKKGYEVADFEDAFSRYIKAPPKNCRPTSQHPANPHSDAVFSGTEEKNEKEAGTHQLSCNGKISIQEAEDTAKKIYRPAENGVNKPKTEGWDGRTEKKGGASTNYFFDEQLVVDYMSSRRYNEEDQDYVLSKCKEDNDIASYYMKEANEWRKEL